MVTFDILGPDGVDVVAKIPMWLNLGMGERAHAGRRGRFFQEWVKANGGPPKRGARMSPRVFTHRMARVEIADTAGELPYSVVRQILSWETGEVFQSFNQYSFNQSISIQPSTSPIKAGTAKEAQVQKLASSACQKFAPQNSVDASALAGVEGNQPNASQGRAAEQRCPQRHVNADALAEIKAMPRPMSDAQLAARRTELDRQAEQLLADRSKQVEAVS